MGIIDRITGPFRKARGDVGTIDQSQHGYPEEAPAGAEAGGETPAAETPQRQSARAGRRYPDEAVDSDDGKATGNPRSAG
jgi:hypothetical protein